MPFNLRQTHYLYNPKLNHYASWLRKNSTFSEVLLWQKIKGKQVLGYKFQRQKPIGRYIVDFYCHELKLAIEVDGFTHDDKVEYDLSRQRTLEVEGIRVLRFTDREVRDNLDNVIQGIADWILANAEGGADGRTTPPYPPARGELTGEQHPPTPLRGGNNNKGNILIFATIYGFISFSLIVVGISGYAISENRASVKKHNREMAFQVAEAGINYYRWHLAHNNTDYQDGTGQPGPYVHEYRDKDGNVIGRFSLDITPPAMGSTVVTVESTGWLDIQPESRRVLRARLGFPSLTDFAFLTNTDVWIGDTEVTHGKFHSNGGIRFDGTGDAPITSAVPTYICKWHHGCSNQEKPGIWGDGGPQEYWSFPVPAQDFSAITANLAAIRDGARSGGLYLSSSGRYGWRLTFTSAGQVTARKVTAVYCYSGKDVGERNYTPKCVDARTYGSPTTYSMPANGYIFVEDTVWADGVVNGRATVGTAAGKSIIINGNITYLARDGSHVLGLIGEKDVLVPRNSPNDLVVDGALLAQNGAAKRYYYPGNIKNSITTYGAVITNGIWTWSWVSGGGSVVSGYRYTNATYDANLTYNPPPGFPVGSEYNLISWEEVE